MIMSEDSDEESGWIASITGAITGAIFGEAGAKVAEKAQEKIESLSKDQLEWAIRAAADKRGVFPENTDPLGDNKLYASSSVASASFDVRRTALAGWGIHVLYGGAGEGLTTTLHAAVRGKKLTDGSKTGARAIVFPSRKARASDGDSDQWLTKFQEDLGKHWVGLTGHDTAQKIVSILVATKENTLANFLRVMRGQGRYPESYDPKTLKDESLDINPLVRGGGQQTKVWRYWKQNDENHAILIGIDDINYNGDLTGEAKAFFEYLISVCKPQGIVLILATHSLDIAKELLKIERWTKPMMTSIKLEGNYENYKELANLRDAIQDKDKFEWDPTLRMGTDGKRKKMLLEKIFNIKTEEEEEVLERALKETTLQDSVLTLKLSGVSPENSPVQQRADCGPVNLPSPKALGNAPGNTHATDLSQNPTSSTVSTLSSPSLHSSHTR